MSQPAISAGVASRPRPNLRSPPCAVTLNARSSSSEMRAALRAAAAALRHLDILNLATGLHQPGLDAVVVVDRIHAADLAQLVLGRLHVAGLVDRARLQQHFAAVPFGLGVEA